MQPAKIAIIICWYGPYPWYFTYFIHSCKFNPTIDFIIITDNNECINNQPVNVNILHKTLEEIKSIASEKLGFEVNIDYAYKLCDFKPAYGFIFQDIISGYDFWGHSDLDVIYGDIREFLNHEMLDTYDFISLRHEYTTGVFALYRNNEKMNTFFMRSKDYKVVFTNPQHYSFGECNFAWNEVVAGKLIFDVETEIESFTHLMKAAEITNEIKVHFDFILMEGTTGRLMFCDGKIIYKKQFDAILYHLYWLKKIYSPQKVPKKIPNVYYISPTRIYHYRKNKIEYDEK
jgi:hypothetical protein